MSTVYPIACPIPFPLKTVNCYYIADSRPTLIDASVDTPESFACLCAGIEKAGGRISALRRIILTHAHTDHAGMAGRLADLSGAEVWVHHWDRPKLVYGDAEKTAEHLERFRRFLVRAGVAGSDAREMSTAFGRRLQRLVSPIGRLRSFADGEVFEFDDYRLRVLHTPGHSAGSVCLFNDAGKEMFAGDTLLEKITPNPVAETNLPPEADGYRSIENYRKSLAHLSALGATVVRPGHGMNFGEPDRRIEALGQHFEHRKARILKRMRRMTGPPAADGATTLCGLACAMFPGLKGLDLFLGLSEAFAYLQLLESERRVTSRSENGVWRFSLIACPDESP